MPASASTPQREPKLCTIRDGKFVDPCALLAETTNVGHPTRTGKGIWSWQWSILAPEGVTPTLTVYGTKSGVHVAKGMLFNYCPFCGTRIDGPALARSRPVDDKSVAVEDGSDDESPVSQEQYDRAVAIVRETGRASVSMVQRRLVLPYRMAARLVERMEVEGVVRRTNAEGAVFVVVEKKA